VVGERLLSEYVRWQDYVADDMILLADGSVMMVIAADGLPFETVDDELVNHRHNQLEFAIRDLNQPGLIFHFLQCRGTANPGLYPRGEFRSRFAELLDEHYRGKLFGDRSMWLNRSYLAIVLPSRMIAGRKIARWLPFRRRGRAEAPAQQIERLRRIVGILCEQLKAYQPKALKIVKRGGFYFSEIAEAIAFALTGYWRQVPLTTGGADTVFSETFIIGHEEIEIRMPHRSSWAAGLGFDDFPYQTQPGMFDRFLSAGYRHTIMHAFECMPSMDGQTLATRKQNRMKIAGDRALSQAAELTRVADDIASNRLMIGGHAGGLLLFTDDRTKLSAIVQDAWADFSSGGAKIERENIALEALLFSMVPGNFHLRGRQAAISSRNFAAFASLHNFPAGDRHGYWGDPIAMCRTSGGTPFLFHLHSGGVGNCLVTGMTGGGKSVFLGWLCCQAERSGATIVLWDKDRGLEAMVRAIDGSYLSLVNTPGIGTGLAPLKRLTDDPEDLAFLSGLIRACISTPAAYDMTPEEDRRLGIALRHVMAAPPELRNLSAVRAFLGGDREGAGARLEKWCAGGEFGWIIDCETDIVDLSGKVMGFDQSSILEDPIAAGAVMATLFHYVGKLVDGRRLLFLLDEVWNALLIPQFHAEIHASLKTWRKYNSPVILATQSIRDALDSPIAHTIREQTPTTVWFSNPRAVWEDIGPGGMNMTSTEFDIIQKLPPGRGFFLLKQGDRSVVLQAPLGGLDDELAVISGTRIGVDAIKIAREETGDVMGEPFVRAYLAALKDLLDAMSGRVMSVAEREEYVFLKGLFPA
jgi:type IV secretion system protein VirB4